MANVTVEIDVECHECGETLATEVYDTTIQVEPCSKCLVMATREGYDEGLSDGEGE